MVVTSLKRAVQASLALLLFAGCGYKANHVNAYETDRQYINREWKEAQAQLIELGVAKAAKVNKVKPGKYLFVKTEGHINCANDYPYAGCFYPNLTEDPKKSFFEGFIHYNRKPGVVKHEARHAILYALADPRAFCIGHNDQSGVPKDIPFK
jgi:hypothetical protein